MNKCKIIKKLRYKILKNYISYVLQRSSTRMFFTVDTFKNFNTSRVLDAVR